MSIPPGSSASLTLRMTVMSPAERAAATKSSLATPTPCSELMEPPRSYHHAENGVIGAVVLGPGADHVDVQVPVAYVPEHDDSGIDSPAQRGRDLGPDRPANSARRVHRQRQVELVRHPERRDRLGVALTVRPQPRTDCRSRRPRRPP